MARKRVILITGAGGYWGSRVAAELAAQPKLHVIGIDEKPPSPEIRELDFIHADIRSPLLPTLLRDEAVDAVGHLAFVEDDRPSEAAFDFNVMGTMRVLAACGEAGVRHAVLKSSTLVYGARPDNSAFLREDRPLHAGRGYGHVRDLIEIESFCHGFRGQAPQVGLTLLRFAHIVGPRVETPLTRLLREEAAPVLLGFDPMMQIVHEADVVAALVAALLRPVPGVFNVASDDTLPLWKLLGLANKTPLPVLHPLAYLAASVLGPKYSPLDLDYLRYPCVGDLHKMRTVLKFVPQYRADETLREFAAEQRLREYAPEPAAYAADDRLRDTLERRARLRARTQANGRRRPAAPRRPRARREPDVLANGRGAALTEERSANG
jgi:UDP-glucose 4-epimerase